MRSFYLLLTVLLFLLAQTVLAHRIAIGSVEPDFVLLVVMFFSLYRGGVRGSLFGFAIGFLQDLGTPQLLGLNALLKSLMGYLVGRAGQKTFPENMAFMFALFFAAAFGHDIVYLVFYTWPRIGSGLASIFTVALPSAVYTALLGVLADRIVSLFGAKVVTAFGKERQQ